MTREELERIAEMDVVAVTFRMRGSSVTRVVLTMDDGTKLYISALDETPLELEAR